MNYFQKISLLYGTIKSRFWDFPSGPMVVKSLHFHCRVAGESLTPGWKTKILHAPRQKTNKKKPKQTRLYRCHLFNVSSSPLNDRGHGSAHPSVLRTADSSSGRPPRRVSLRPGATHWGCPCSQLPAFLTAPQAPRRSGPKAVPDGDPEQR